MAYFGKLEETYSPGDRRGLFGLPQRRVVRDLPTLVLYVWSESTVCNTRVTRSRPAPPTPFDDMMNVDTRYVRLKISVRKLTDFTVRTGTLLL